MRPATSPWLRALRLVVPLAVAGVFCQTPSRADESPDDAPFDAPIHVDDAALPSPVRTPGDVFGKANLKELCAKKPDALPLPSAGLCDQAFAAYNIRPEQRFQYACRYLVPLGIGGATTAANVWPQIADEAALKDRLDRDLTRRTCNEEVSMTSAQRAIAADWIAAYRKYLIPDDPAPLTLKAHAPVAHARRKPSTTDDPTADDAAAIAGALAPTAGGSDPGAGYAPQSAPQQSGPGGGNSGGGGGNAGGGGTGPNGSNRQQTTQTPDGIGHRVVPGSYAPLIDRSSRQNGGGGGGRTTTQAPRTKAITPRASGRRNIRTSLRRR